MTRWLASLGLQRVLLPIGLIAGAILRQNGLSAVYLILLLYNPAVPVPSPKTMAGHTGYYQKAVIFFTVLNVISTFVFQIVLISHPPYGSLVTPVCGQLERILRYTGLIRLDGIEVWNGIRVFAPEVIVLIISIATYALCSALNPVKSLDDQLLPVAAEQTHQSNNEEMARQRKASLLVVLGKYVCLISLCFAGILRPSALSGVYYLVFLGSMTWWACNKPLGKSFAYICRTLLFVVAGHLAALFLYQMQWAQELLPHGAPVARYLGLTILSNTTCDDPRTCHLTSEEWASFVNPIALVWLYFILWYEANLIINAPLIRGRESLYHRGTPKRLIQDSMGSVTISEVPEESSKMDNLPEEEEEAGPGVLEIVVNAAMTIAQILTQSSYVGTIIIMMAWSITYHSWLTFVLLLWASVMWLMPNQRRAMLRSSPCLVLYAQLLLLAQYIYGMRLTDEELPQTVQGLNLRQIGLAKVTYLPVKPLLIKTIYTVMFWITLKQYNQEKWESRNQSALADIAAPLQIGVGTATSTGGDAQTKTSQLIQKIGHTVRSLMTKFWIWVVASILFGIGITGERITIFRIVYMALALIFILTFQLSWAAWRKMMYGFWLTVIIYSMLILVMTYTYQFDNFPEYWERYLHIPPTLQLDIGLERFETTQLFVKLLTPTFFVVITVVQLYYFHKDFLAISDIKSRGTSSVRPRVSDGSSAMPRSDRSSAGIDPGSEFGRKQSGVQPKRSFHIVQTLMNLRMHLAVSKLQDLLNQTCELIWLFLELHMLKLIMLSIILLAVYDVCAMHLAFVLLSVISLTFGSKIQTMAAHATSVLVSLLLLAKMIYQIKYIDHEHWNVTCPSENRTWNTAEWIGFRKTDSSNSLPHLLKGYIGVIMVVTIHSVVLMRQKYQRHLRGRPLSRPLIMFPRISYREADKDIKNCIKYLLNYGFYRFGVEISLIGIVALIGTRMDLYAVLYSFWLCILITPRRAVLAKMWGVFTLFIVITIPIQYVLVVGLPPSLCIVYPWEESETLQRLQEWMFFPDPVHPPPAYKLLCDFIVLLLVCRQGVVFRIERRHNEQEYPGGTNKSITQEAERPDFVNPIPDYISHIRSWLDVVKRVVLSAFIWVTLAIVFLAGTNRVNLFSLGYLIGAFIFLWQGNDFYLRPINVILRWWNYLISYNVVIILIKAVLQILGCIFIKEMQTHACWAVQVLGIACIKKFADSAAARGVFDPVECSVPRGDVGLAWDGFCFGFLILQRRLFNSYYFFHIVDEAKAMAILASRGAELIEELSKKQISEQQEAERKILEKIKYKMDRIKASQQKVQGPGYKEPASHHIAIRSGDYYMFDDPDDEELDLICEQQSESSADDDEGEKARQRPDVFEGDPKAGPSSVKDGDSSRRGDSESEDEKEDSKSHGLRFHDVPDGFSPDDDMKKFRADSVIDALMLEEEPKDQTLSDRILTFLKFLWAFITSIMVTVTRSLNKFSRDYRYVMRTLAIEKKQLKERAGFGAGIRSGSTNMWQPLPNMIAKTKTSPICLEELEDDRELSAADQPPIVRLILAIWFAIISHSELVCYFIIFLHQIRSPTLLSLPLPLMVFLWGTLTVPRPSKTFWVTIIAYTEVVVVVKCMFQFEILPWNQQVAPDNAPFFPPRIIGIERQPGMYAYYDLLLLLVVFFHRSMLKSLGLWKSSLNIATMNDHHGSSANSSDHSKVRDAEEGSIITVMNNKAPENIEKAIEVRDGDWAHHEGDEENKEYLTSIIPIRTARYLSPMRRFFHSLLKPSVRVTADVYAYMFFCDFFNFLVVIFGFASFGSQQGDGGVSQYFEENKVPVAFLVMLILQFGLIIVDRTLYLRKFILGKVIFQFILVIGIHVWMFFILPAVTDRQFNANLPPQMWYMVKCFYLLLSAYQIRSGYPTRILGNFLCKSYNYINMFLFKVFMAVPFVFELRALMDWIWTDTSMTLSDWLKMEDIFAHIFQLKCQRRAETEYPQPRGEKKASFHKYIVGGGCLVGIIAVIWFPLVLFALGNTVGQPNLPYDVTVSVRIGAYQPIYTYSAQNNSIYTFNEKMWDNLGQAYKRSRVAQTFLSNYEFEDVGVIKLSSHSTSIWTISPPDNITLIDELKSSKSVSVKLEWVVSRKSNNPEQPGVASSSVEVWLPANDVRRALLVKLLTGQTTNETVVLPDILPKFIKVTSRGTASPISQLMAVEDIPIKNPYRSLVASLNRTSEEMTWWELMEDCRDKTYDSLLKWLPYTDCSSLVMYTFNDKAFPATLNIISGKGIIGLYTTFVIVIHSVIRGFFTGISFKIMFDDMPNVDRILQLCLDIYLVRESGELDLEEDLFAKLVFLYRSPETLIKWTRPPEEVEEDGENPQGHLE